MYQDPVLQPYEQYMAKLAEKYPSHTVVAFLNKHGGALRRSSMFQNYDPSNPYLHAFTRVILDNHEILVPFFKEVLEKSALHPVRETRPSSEFRFMIPSGNDMCHSYYVNFSPLSVLFFLFAWMKHYHTAVTNKYISDNEFKCIQRFINNCRYSPNVLIRATALLFERPGTDVCKAISRALAIEDSEPVILEKVVLPEASRR